ncbi:MAG: hypothetical protein IRY97_03960 [Thermomicrobiaceae bacterium]|nr:hypothetical protein [Thermomicrobiaceae bacterium]
MLFGLALAIGVAQESLVARLRAAAPRVRRWGGVVLLVVGLWTLALGAFADFFARRFPV